ncbi:hypothetical protein KBD08_00505 [Candidatus Babeliales bacterium]|nr:hypothetical protein [Candidatus Babeliales bacterium]
MLFFLVAFDISYASQSPAFFDQIVHVRGSTQGSAMSGDIVCVDDSDCKEIVICDINAYPFRQELEPRHCSTRGNGALQQALQSQEITILRLTQAVYAMYITILRPSISEEMNFQQHYTIQNMRLVFDPVTRSLTNFWSCWCNKHIFSGIAVAHMTPEGYVLPLESIS